jgi:hypothetical protein
MPMKIRVRVFTLPAIVLLAGPAPAWSGDLVRKVAGSATSEFDLTCPAPRTANLQRR